MAPPSQVAFGAEVVVDIGVDRGELLRLLICLTPQFTTFVSTYSRLLVEHREDGSIHFQCMD